MSTWVKRAQNRELPVSDRTGFIATGKADRFPGADRNAAQAHNQTVACLQGKCEEGCK